MKAWLVYLGKAVSTDVTSQLLVPSSLVEGEVIPLDLRHPERWRRTDVTRVIVGSEPDWADVVLADEPLTIRREHARFYLNHHAPERSDFRVMKACLAHVNGRVQPPVEWFNIQRGDELQLSCWRFRYEWTT